MVGNSLGGAMSITLGSRRPDLVRGLGLVAPAGARVAEERLEALFKSLQVTTRAEAVQLTEEALVGRKITLGPHHSATLATMVNLANGYSDLGESWSVPTM